MSLRVCTGEAWNLPQCKYVDHEPVSPPPVLGKCSHLGISVRKVECKTCKLKTNFKVFLCGVHGECTTNPVETVNGEELHACRGCSDYKPA